ncbi:unnamed protein product [Orchesella dallaii]|uniref:Phorbol-ester/DAG-type domain-containing protein n=1 Tax=Orchesella dallaii TaxID=48710 RepID=A0ABP1QWN2_9HEXA
MDSKSGVGIHSTSTSRACGNLTKKKPEDGDGRNSTTEECDSTTDSNSQFRVGEPVFYIEGEALLFCTVELVQGKRVKLAYDDGTIKFASISQIKKVETACSPVKEEVEEVKLKSCPISPPLLPPNDTGGGVSKKKSTKCDVNGQVTPKENHQVTCGSCGTQKIITRKKAMELLPYNQYNCRKCINKSKTSKNNGVPIMAAAHYLGANSRQRQRSSETNGGMDPHKLRMLEHGIANGVVFRSESDKCLHCRNQIAEKVSLHCTMCERPCHPSCLALTPPPLPGDIFWSIICHVCGTQKHNDSPENDSQKLYSSRRSISSWSDVAYLLLSCLGCMHPNDKFFDLDKQIIPFWEEYVSRLHLPRQYKTAQDSDRRSHLLLALNNASLRFLKDDRKKSEHWSIKESTTRSIQMVKVIKPPAVTPGRGVTAAGFPISVRASNPEAASVAMSNIAQTIATQAAANKANNQGVPPPKNSPSHISPKTSSLKSSGASTVGPSSGTTKKQSKSDQAAPVAKKTGSELNNGVQWKNNIWPQSKFGGTKFLPELPKSTANAVLGNPVGGDSSSSNLPLYPTVGPSQRVQQIQQQKQHTVILQPSVGGAARVTGVVVASSSSSATTSQAPETSNNRVGGIGSYPVRKNGSPILSKSIRVEALERKKDVVVVDNTNSANNSCSFASDNKKKSEDVIRESPGFNNQLNQQRAPVKRKLSIPAKTSTDSSPPASSSSSQSRSDDHDLTSAAKKVKLSLPSSTDVTSKRLPSSSSLHSSDSPADVMDHQGQGVNSSGKGRTDVLAITYDKAGQAFSTPIKNSIGATSTSSSPLTNGAQAQVPDRKSGSVEEEITKEKTNTNVTTSPRVFKHASVSTPGAASPCKPSSSSPVAERRMRPVRLKRAVVANAQAEKQSKETELGGKLGKRVNGKILSNAATAALNTAKSRGRPKKPFRQLVRRPVGNQGFNLGQFNGSVDKKNDSASTDTVNESEFSWKGATVADLLEHGHGYRLGCLPKAPEGKEEMVEMKESAIKHLREELAPRPPSYWSTSSSLTMNHSKKSANQRSRKDLKDTDSYYISGCRRDEKGVQYQVVWRDGQGFETTSDDEQELGIEFGSEYMYFQDYDFFQHFFDKVPVDSNAGGDESGSDCDNNMEQGGNDEGGEPSSKKVSVGNNCNGDGVQKGTIAASEPGAVKAEPRDVENASGITQNGKKWAEKALEKDADVAKNGEDNEAVAHDDGSDPIIIDLTDSP